MRVEVNPVNVGGAAEIERAVAAFARAPNGGLIATGGGRMRSHRDLIVKLVARHKLPAVYYDRVYVDSGGLMCVHAPHHASRREDLLMAIQVTPTDIQKMEFDVTTAEGPCRVTVVTGAINQSITAASPRA